MRTHPLTQITLALTLVMAMVDAALIHQHWQEKSTTKTAVAATRLPEEWMIRTTSAEPQPAFDFIFQTPYGLWEKPWDEFAEEAVIAMIVNAHTGEELSTRDLKASALLRVWEAVQSRYGEKNTLTIPEVAQILNDLTPEISVKLIQNPSLITFTDELESGYWFVVPINGQAMQNPRYGKPGPRHHMILITAYNAENNTFVTQDPGTSRGKNAEYDAQKILDVIEDLDGSKTILAIRN